METQPAAFDVFAEQTLYLASELALLDANKRFRPPSLSFSGMKAVDCSGERLTTQSVGRTRAAAGQGMHGDGAAGRADENRWCGKEKRQNQYSAAQAYGFAGDD